jgi:hypothetical protein
MASVNKQLVVLVKKGREYWNASNGYDLRLINLSAEDKNSLLRFVPCFEQNRNTVILRGNAVIDCTGIDFRTYIRICLTHRVFFRNIVLQDSFFKYCRTKLKFLARAGFWRLMGFRFSIQLPKSFIDQMLYGIFLKRIAFVSSADFFSRKIFKGKYFRIANGIANRTYISLPPDARRAHGRGIRFCFWGNIDYEPNFLSTVYFLRQYWCQLQCDFPDSELNIYGGGQSKIMGLANKLRLDISHVHFCGRFEKVEDIAIYNDVCVNLVEFGAGMMNKTIEAVAIGIPMVTTSHAIEGIPELRDYPFVYHDYPSLKLAICNLMKSNEENRRRLAITILDNYRWEKTYKDYVGLFLRGQE